MIHKYLAYLKTIETGSITQAAAELGYTQSAVSRMIADLEEHWDVPLLTRNRSGIEISSEGTQLLPILQSIVKGQEELSFAVGELHGLQSGLIRVGAFTSMATGWMPLMIKSFHEKYPNIRFQQPLRAMPLTSVFMMSGISSLVMPPMATIGISIFSAFIFWMISLYPSRPRIGESFSLVVVKRNGPQPM